MLLPLKSKSALLLRFNDIVKVELLLGQDCNNRLEYLVVQLLQMHANTSILLTLAHAIQ